MSGSQEDAVRLYLDPARTDDPRTLLAVSHGGEGRVYVFGPDGSPADPDRLAALIRSAPLLAPVSQRGAIRSRLGAEGLQIEPLPAEEEVRLRLLAGRERKWSPYRPPAASDDAAAPLPDDLDALLSGILPAGPKATPGPAPAPPEPEPDLDLIREIARRSRDIPPLQPFMSDPPSVDDLEALLDGAGPDLDEATEPPPPFGRIKESLRRMRRIVLGPEADTDDLDLLFSSMGWDEPDPLISESGPSRDDPDHDVTLDPLEEPLPVASDPGPSRAGPSAPEGGIGPDGGVTPPEEELNVYPVLERRRTGLLRHLLDSFSDPLRFDRALSGIQAELQERARDPDRFFRPGREELWGARLGRDILHEDRYVCVAWTDQLEGRLRLRLVRFSDAKDLRPHHERGMRLLMDRIARYERGPIEALLPPSLRVSPDLMRAGGFAHQLDLPRWVWGEDCALWVRPPAAG